MELELVRQARGKRFDRDGQRKLGGQWDWEHGHRVDHARRDDAEALRLGQIQFLRLAVEPTASS